MSSKIFVYSTIINLPYLELQFSLIDEKFLSLQVGIVEASMFSSLGFRPECIIDISKLGRFCELGKIVLDLFNNIVSLRFGHSVEKGKTNEPLAFCRRVILGM